MIELDRSATPFPPGFVIDKSKVVALEWVPDSPTPADAKPVEFQVYASPDPDWECEGCNATNSYGDECCRECRKKREEKPAQE